MRKEESGKRNDSRGEKVKVESSFVFLKNVRFYAFHGVMALERQVGGEFLLSLRVGYPIDKAMESDDVKDTLNYATLYDLAKREMDIPSQLLEHVAGRIVKAITAAFPEVTSVDLELTKQNPPMGADCDGAGVELRINSCVPSVASGKAERVKFVKFV